VSLKRSNLLYVTTRRLVNNCGSFEEGYVSFFRAKKTKEELLIGVRDWYTAAEVDKPSTSIHTVNQSNKSDVEGYLTGK